MAEHQWLWICRWEEFQHYSPERDRSPAWIKTYTKQLDDDRYTDLSPRRRALLHDLRIAFARTSGRLSDSTRTLSRRTLSQVRRDDLISLTHAGFLEVVSRATLESRLEEVYTSRAPARSSEEEREVEEELSLDSSSSSLRGDETDAAAPALNGRAALVDHEDDIPLPAVRAEPTFPCPHCHWVGTTWSDYTLHLTLDHPEVPA